MAGFFKPRRRRGPAGPNKNEQKVMRGQEAERRNRAAGVLKEQFPFVENLSVRLEFLTPQNDPYEEQTRAFSPDDPCDFSVACPGRCGGQGSFDLEAKIRSVIDGRHTRAEGQGICQETLYGGSTDTCGFRLKCQITVAYGSEPPAE